MGLFDMFKSSEGSFMDVIRCDREEYLVHKWSPSGELNSSKRENAIRFGSRIRIKPGEAAVFFYRQNEGKQLDILEGPLDKTLKTANLPILSDIIGLAYGGDSPFMAEIYFFNLQQNVQIKFGIPYFDVFDSRLPELGIPCAVRGSLVFNITDPAAFIKLYRLRNFEIDDLEEQVKDLYTRKIKSFVLNIPIETGLSVMQLERNVDSISEYLMQKLKPEMEADFGINLKRVDIGNIELFNTHPNYLQLKEATADQQTKFTVAKTGVEITNLEELARINRKDVEMGVEGKNFAVHQINSQADILKTAANNLGEMSNINLGNGDGFSPLGIATGFAVGRTMGTQMGGMMGSMMNIPPPPPVASWHIALNGQQFGPYSLNQLEDLATSGQFTLEHYVWKQGMAEWKSIGELPEIAAVFNSAPPLPPPPAK